MDRLDTALTVGQMQGKFQLSVMPTAGHAIHEDEPRKVAELIATFITRHKFADANRKFLLVFLIKKYFSQFYSSKRYSRTRRTWENARNDVNPMINPTVPMFIVLFNCRYIL